MKHSLATAVSLPFQSLDARRRGYWKRRPRGTPPGFWIPINLIFTEHCCSTPASISASARHATARILTAGRRRWDAGVSCFSCHKLGLMKPEWACGACHSYPPSTGRHGIHAAGGALAKSFACSTCHPDHQSGQDHAFASDGSLRTGHAQVSLTGLAALSPADGTRWGRRLGIRAVEPAATSTATVPPTQTRRR